MSCVRIGALRPSTGRDPGELILEDDYGGEFRYDRQPVGALQGLDPKRVVYFGSASKSLAPGLRLAWMVLPEEPVPNLLASVGRSSGQWRGAVEYAGLVGFIAIVGAVVQQQL